jgi:hypothetical protein
VPAFSHLVKSLSHYVLQHTLTMRQQCYKNMSMVWSSPLPAHELSLLESIHQAHDAMVFQMESIG